MVIRRAWWARSSGGSVKLSVAGKQRDFLNSAWAMAAILLLAVALRLVALGAKDLWHDEAYSLAFAQTGIAYQLQRPTAAPPLYHLVLHFWLRLGQSDAFLRLPSALAGIAAVWVTYLIGRRLAGRAMGLALSLLVATSPLLIWYAQEARYYSFLYFFSVLSLYFYLCVKDRGGRRAWVGYWISSFLCLYVHYYSIMLFLVQNLDFLLALRKRETRCLWKGWLLAQASLMASFLPWALIFLSQARDATRGKTYYPQPDVMDLGRTVLDFVVGRERPIYGGVLIPLIGLAGVWGLWLALRRKRSALLWLLLLIVPVGLAFLISCRVPIYETKHLIASSLACHVLLAYAVALPRRWKLSVAALAAVLGPSIAGLWVYYSLPARQSWHQAARLVEARQRPGDVILFDGKIGYLGFSHYYQGNLDMYGLYGAPFWAWEMPDEAEYPLEGAFWANYGEIGGYFPRETLPKMAHWRRQPDQIAEGYRRVWLVLFANRWSLVEHEARLGAECYPATGEALGEIQLYRCDLESQS